MVIHKRNIKEWKNKVVNFMALHIMRKTILVAVYIKGRL